MSGSFVSKFMLAVAAVLLIGIVISQSAFVARAAEPPVSLPDPAVDTPLAKTSAKQVGVVAGGCFWGIQAVFQHVKGVTDATSGYSGGSSGTAQYEIVSTGATGHAESVKITYDASKITYGQLLKVFFSVAHDPTQLNHQGADRGTQYRSVVFYATEEQKRVAEAYIAQLDKAKVFPRPIVTQVVPLKGFYDAEAYHQNYATLHPDQPYIAMNDLPKVANLQKLLPDLYVGK